MSEVGGRSAKDDGPVYSGILSSSYTETKRSQLKLGMVVCLRYLYLHDEFGGDGYEVPRTIGVWLVVSDNWLATLLRGKWGICAP